MTTTEAMKQAQHLLRWTHFGECRTYQGPAPEAREVDKLLSEAIATEEAQWVEPVARVKRLTNCSIIDSTGCTPCWEDLPDGTALFIRPPPANHIGDATKLLGERAALIEKLQWAAKVGGDAILHVGGAETHKKAANMLAADAQTPSIDYSDKATIAGLESSILHLSALVNDQLLLLAEVNTKLGVDGLGVELNDGESELIDRVRAHCAAMSPPTAPAHQLVPKRVSRIHVTAEMHHAAVKVLHRASGLDGLPQRMLNAMLAAAQQADALASEDVRAMVPMTEQELDDLLPTNDSMSRKDSQRWIARAVERRNGIGVKP